MCLIAAFKRKKWKELYLTQISITLILVYFFFCDFHFHFTRLWLQANNSKSYATFNHDLFRKFDDFIQSHTCLPDDYGKKIKIVIEIKVFLSSSKIKKKCEKKCSLWFHYFEHAELMKLNEYMHFDRNILWIFHKIHVKCESFVWINSLPTSSLAIERQWNSTPQRFYIEFCGQFTNMQRLFTKINMTTMLDIIKQLEAFLPHDEIKRVLAKLQTHAWDERHQVEW